jgi:hypothetical protein
MLLALALLGSAANAAPVLVDGPLDVPPVSSLQTLPSAGLPSASEAPPFSLEPSQAPLRPLSEALPLEPVESPRPAALAGLSAAGSAPVSPGADRTLDFIKLYDGARRGRSSFSPAAADHRFLLVPGFMWDFCPGMFGPNIDELRSMGIDTKLVKVHSMGATARNAAIVAEAIERSPKPVVLVAHSKGGLDAMQALADRPDLASKVAASWRSKRLSTASPSPRRCATGRSCG